MPVIHEVQQRFRILRKLCPRHITLKHDRILGRVDTGSLNLLPDLAVMDVGVGRIRISSLLFFGFLILVVRYAERCPGVTDAVGDIVRIRLIVFEIQSAISDSDRVLTVTATSLSSW